MGQRFFFLALGLFVATIGCFFTWVMAQSYLNAKETRNWFTASAKITVAEVEERKIGEHVPVDYAAKVSYNYEFDGKKYTGELLTPRGQKWVKELEKAQYDLEPFEKGLKTTCYVNPVDHEEAILRHDTKAVGYSIWFPMLFVIGGIGVMVGAFRGNVKVNNN